MRSYKIDTVVICTGGVSEREKGCENCVLLATGTVIVGDMNNIDGCEGI
jgi:hypothetical protein